MSLGSHLAPLTARFAGSGERAVMVSLGASAISLLLLGATAAFTGVGSMILAAIGYGLVYLGLGAAGPGENALLHRHVSSPGRATALSVQSLALQLVAALTGLIIGVLPSGLPPWLLGGTVLLAGALLWIHRNGPTPETPAETPQRHTVSPSLSTTDSNSLQQHADQ
ncbi:hypothetical protein [Streptomyces sp. DH24]|uniref:hypothetical protein n=1 Tax=Streptomyces sp. DH24 TaxID=3040123 RepID=UPI003014B5A5